ncbi:MAG: tetratricopeptide repeat protein [Kiritimatiellia bacterium]
MPWTAAAVLLALAGRAAEGIPPVFLDGVWVQHLRARIAAAEGNDRRVERHARDLLRVKPDDAGALLALVETLHRQDKRGLASALVRFAHLAHPADARITVLYDRLKDLRPAGGGAFAPDTQIQTLSASVQETAIRGDADGLRAAEDQLAGMLVRFRPSINHLDALKAAYRELDEPTLEAALLIEIILQEPGRLDDLKRLSVLLKRMDAGRVLAPTLQELNAKDRAPGFDAAAGAALSTVGAHAEAARHFNRWVEAAPKNGEAWSALGIALYESGDVVRARAVLIKASLLAPDLKPVYTTLARIAAEQRDPDDALIWLRRLMPMINEQELSELLMQPGFNNIPEVLYQLR